MSASEKCPANKYGVHGGYDFRDVEGDLAIREVFCIQCREVVTAILLSSPRALSDRPAPGPGGGE